MKQALLIVNATAGKNRLRNHVVDMVEQFCRADYAVEIAVTLRAQHAEELAYNGAEQGKDLIVCCGGDGTLNEVVAGILRSGKKVDLGYIPSGSTNDFAQSTGIPFQVEQAVERIVSGDTKTLDVGTFNGRNFNYVAAFGAFTAVSYRTSKSMKKTFGHLAYLFEGVKDLGSIVPHTLKITTDEGEVLEGEYSFGAIGNSRSIAGMVHIPEEIVSMNDGLFEILLIKMPKNPAHLASIVQGLTFSNFTNEMFQLVQSKKITIESDGSFDWTLDGEFAPGAEKVEICNLHNGITMRF